MAIASIPLDEWSGSAATNQLHQTIKLQIDAIDKQAAVAKRWQALVVALSIIQTTAAIASIAELFMRHA